MDAYYSTMMQVITVLLLVVLIESSAAALFLRKWLSLYKTLDDEDRDELLLWKGGLLWRLEFRFSVYTSVMLTYVMPAFMSVTAYVVSIDNLTSGRAGPMIQLIHRVIYLGPRESSIVKGVGPGDAAIVSYCLMFMIVIVVTVSLLMFSLQRKEVAEQHRPTTRPHGRD